MLDGSVCGGVARAAELGVSFFFTGTGPRASTLSSSSAASDVDARQGAGTVSGAGAGAGTVAGTVYSAGTVSGATTGPRAGAAAGDGAGAGAVTVSGAGAVAGTVACSFVKSPCT